MYAAKNGCQPSRSLFKESGLLYCTCLAFLSKSLHPRGGCEACKSVRFQVSVMLLRRIVALSGLTEPLH